MYTSYFGRLNSHEFMHLAGNGISISQGNRFWYGQQYRPLAPPWHIVNMEDPVEYEKAYREQVLAKLDPMNVYCEIMELAGPNAILLCHESVKKIEETGFKCHRMIVANWLETELWADYGMEIQIQELRSAKSDLKDILKQKKIDDDWAQLEMDW